MLMPTAQAQLVVTTERKARHSGIHRRRLWHHPARSDMSSERKRQAEEDGPTSPSFRRRVEAVDKPVYLVVEHDEEPAYSIRIVGAAGTAGTKAPIIPLQFSQPGMSFAAVETPQGSWIVGVGGACNQVSTIYDVAARKEWEVPWIKTCKMEPVLIPVRDQLYVLSRRPSIKWAERRGEDYLNWFEHISFKIGVPLEPPPVFPCRINPLEYKNPPAVCVASYAVVGSRILLSVQLDNVNKVKKRYMGTCAYDVDRKVWEMVHEMNLPFLGQAVPLSDHLCLARSEVRDGAAVVYSMSIIQAPSGTSKLLIDEVKVVTPKGRIVLGELLFPLESERFCSVCVQSVGSKFNKARVVRRTYAVVGYDTVNKQVVIEKELGRVCELAYPPPVVAALTMAQRSRIRLHSQGVGKLCRANKSWLGVGFTIDALK